MDVEDGEGVVVVMGVVEVDMVGIAVGVEGDMVGIEEEGVMVETVVGVALVVLVVDGGGEGQGNREGNVYLVFDLSFPSSFH